MQIQGVDEVCVDDSFHSRIPGPTNFQLYEHHAAIPLANKMLSLRNLKYFRKVPLGKTIFFYNMYTFLKYY